MLQMSQMPTESTDLTVFQLVIMSLWLIPPIQISRPLRLLPILTYPPHVQAPIVTVKLGFPFWQGKLIWERISVFRRLV